MKFVRAVEQLEAVATERAATKKQRGVAWGLIWADYDGAEPIDREDLEPGQSVAVDLMVTEELPGVRICRVVERVTTTPGDGGWVLNAAGELAGRVISSDGSMINVAWEFAASGA